MSRQDLEQPPMAPAGRSRRKPLDPVLLERLAETGFLATELGLDDHAERIFQCLEKLKPGKPSPRIALAMVQARRGHMEAAMAALRTLIEEHPESELARAVLGTMLLHVGEPDARRMLEEVIARGANQDAVAVAASCIEQARANESQQANATPPLFELRRHHNIRG